MTKSSAGGLSPDLENFVMTKFFAPMPTDAELMFLTPKVAAVKPPFSTTPAGRRGRRADLQVNGLYCKQRHYARRQRPRESNSRPARTGPPDARRTHVSICLDVLGHDQEFLRHDEKTRGSVG